MSYAQHSHNTHNTLIIAEANAIFMPPPSPSTDNTEWNSSCPFCFPSRKNARPSIYVPHSIYKHIIIYRFFTAYGPFVRIQLQFTKHFKTQKNSNVGLVWVPALLVSQELVSARFCSILFLLFLSIRERLLYIRNACAVWIGI